MRMKRAALAAFVLAGFGFWGTGAQALTPEERLQLAGEFIGAHARIYAIGTRCNYTVDGLYGPEIALQTIAPLLTPEERMTLDAYLGSSDFTQSVAVIENDIEQAWKTLTAEQGKSESQSCATLIERAIARHRDVNGRLKDLH